MGHQGEEHNSTFIGFAEVMVNRPQLYNASRLLEEEKNTNPSFFDEGAYPNPSSTGAPWILSRSLLDANIDNLSLHQLIIYLIHVFREADSGWKNETAEVPQIFSRLIGTFNKIMNKVYALKNDRYKTVVKLYNIFSLMYFIYLSFIPCDTQPHSCHTEVHSFIVNLFYFAVYCKNKYEMNDDGFLLIDRRVSDIILSVTSFNTVFRTSDDAVGGSEMSIKDLPDGAFIVPFVFQSIFSVFEFVEESSELCNYLVEYEIPGMNIKTSSENFFADIIEPYIESTTQQTGTMTSEESMRKLLELKPSSSGTKYDQQVILIAIMSDLQQRFHARSNELRSRNELFNSDEVKYVFYMVISGLHFITNNENIEFASVIETVLILSKVLDNLHLAEIIPVINADTAVVLQHEMEELTKKFAIENNSYLKFTGLYWIPRMIFVSRGGYKRCTYTGKGKLIEKYYMKFHYFIKSVDDIKGNRDAWIATLTRFKSGADFSSQFNEGECPVCIEKTDNFAIFACGHGVCFRCLDALENFDYK